MFNILKIYILLKVFLCLYTYEQMINQKYKWRSKHILEK